jgi:SWI/SNF-related matrix-associated actin-dependent regulator of chromatin subfamily A member 5
VLALLVLILVLALLVLMLQLVSVGWFQVCNHPYMFPEAEPDFDGSTAEDIVEASGKLAVLDILLQQLYKGGHRVVLFSQFTNMLNIMEDLLLMRGFEGKYLRLDGSVNRVRRTIDIAEFNRGATKGVDDRPFCFLMSTRAGGLGVNLQTADTVILYDSDWNPQVDAQAIARVHRIGQKGKVAALRLVTAGTVEQRVVERAEKKLYLDAMVGRGSSSNAEDLDKKEEGGTSKGELLATLAFGTDRIFATDEGRMPTEAELAALLAGARDPKEANTFEEVGGVQLKAAKQNAGAFDTKDFGYSVQTTTELRADMLGDILAKHRAEHNLSSVSNLSMKSIAKEARETLEMGKRQHQSRLVEVADQWGKKHSVLRENMYDLASGEPSVFSEMKGGGEFQAMCGKQQHSRKTAGKDYKHSDLCQMCWEPAGYWGKGTWESELVLCGGCPVVYHNKCLAESGREVTQMIKGMQCLHHDCKVCGIKAQAAGGLLLRCEVCEDAYCEDHLPVFAAEEEEDGWAAACAGGSCRRFEQLGQVQPKQAYFITCSKDCRQWKQAHPRMFCVVEGMKKKPTSAIEKSPGAVKVRILSFITIEDVSGEGKDGRGRWSADVCVARPIIRPNNNKKKTI